MLVLTATTILLRLGILQILSSRLIPTFDSSARLISWPTPFLLVLRWDCFHFYAVAAAANAYAYESQWAFLAATPFLIRILNNFLWFPVLLFTACYSTKTLYYLSLFHFPSFPALARLVALLSLIPTSPATLYFAPYSEPFFTCLSYKGMLYTAKQSWISATLCFTFASTFRSNGTLLCGYILWGLVVQPFLDRRQISFTKTIYAIFLSVVICSPFIYHNYSAYRLFCKSPSPSPHPAWCNHFLPSVYTHVQSTYWNVGFLRYWQLSQVPNFLISAPPLALLLAFSLHHLTQGFLPHLSLRSLFQSPSSPFLTPTITPHVLHTLFMCITLLFFSHTQIVLRLSAALPTLYWGAAWLLLEHNGGNGKGWPWGQLWVGWSVTWGLVSLGLWAAFLPPA